MTANFPLPGHDRYSVPTSGSLAPVGGNTDAATFTAMWGDTNGAPDLSFVEIVFTPDPTLSYLASVMNACHIQYYPYYNEVRLDDAAGDGQFPYSSAIGSGGQPLSNGICIVDSAIATASPSGDDETLTVPVIFTQGSTYYLWTSATTKEDVFNSWAYWGDGTATGAQTAIGPLTYQAPPNPAPAPRPLRMFRIR